MSIEYKICLFGLGETLNEPNLVIHRFHVIGFTLKVLEVVAPIYVVMG